MRWTSNRSRDTSNDLATIVCIIEKKDFVEAAFSNLVNIGEILSNCLTRCALQLQRIELDISFL